MLLTIQLHTVQSTHAQSLQAQCFSYFWNGLSCTEIDWQYYLCKCYAAHAAAVLAGVHEEGYFSFPFHSDHLKLYCVLILLPACEIIMLYRPLAALGKCVLSQVCNFARFYVSMCVCNCSVVWDH